MPQYTTFLGQYFTVSRIAYSIATDIFVNITKRREQIVYSSSLPATSAGISYLDGIPTSANDCISITDISSQTLGNYNTVAADPNSYDLMTPTDLYATGALHLGSEQAPYLSSY